MLRNLQLLAKYFELQCKIKMSNIESKCCEVLLVCELTKTDS